MFSSNEMMQGTSGILGSPRAVRRISYECARFFPSHIGFLVIFLFSGGNGRQMIPGNCKSGQLPGIPASCIVVLDREAVQQVCSGKLE